jgi:hypothetical protein
MADISQANWSETDSANNASAPDGFPEGMPPSGVNDAARAVMGAVKRFWDRSNAVLASTGSANAYALTYGMAPSAYATGERYAFRASFTNTGAATLNINGLGAKNVRKGDGTTALGANDILVSQIVEVVYDGTQFQMVSRTGNAEAVATTAVSGIVELATDGETAAGADTARAMTPSNAAANFGYQGKQTIWIPAIAMTARTTNGAAIGIAELATNRNMLRTLDFDTAAEEFAQVEIAMPKSWNEGAVTFQALWTAASGSGGVAWGVQAIATGDDDALDAAFGTEVVVTDTLIAANDCHITAESAAITIGGTPAENDRVQIQVSRNVADATDTLAVDSKLLGIRLFYTTNAKNDA